MIRPKTPAHMLATYLDYDPEAGTLTWRARAIDRPVGWNKKWAGKPAFTALSKTGGYPHGRIFGRLYKAHQVAWAMGYGEWSTLQIDHINHNKLDYRLCNLREVTNLENHRNRRMSPRNTSGVTGVYRDRTRWVAAIVVQKKAIHLGSFGTVAEAAEARRAGELRYGFHPNHGRAPA